MTVQGTAAPRAEEFFRHHDAKDIPYIRSVAADDCQFVDEISRAWMRGRSAFEAYLAENFPRITDLHSVVEADTVRSWGDVEVETFLLRQHYVFDGAAYDIEAPTTLIWHRDGEAWKVVVIHSIPLAPASQ